MPSSGSPSERRRQRVRDVRRRLVDDGPPWTRGHAGDFEVVTVPEGDCDALRDLLIAEGVEAVVEVGLAYGSSALAIGEALVAVDPPRPLHIIIDAGHGMVERRLAAAGVRREPSSMALPRLVADGLAADAAFVDASHKFHEVFVDLYFLRKIVRPGGIVVLDDHWWPSVATAARYFQLNLGWRVIPGAFEDGTVDQQTGHPRLQAFRLPDPPVEPSFQAFQPF